MLMLVISTKRVILAYILLGALKLPDAATLEAMELHYILWYLTDLLGDHLRKQQPHVNSTLQRRILPTHTC